MKHKSHGVPKVTDPRVEMTRSRIAAAFVALVSKRAYGRLRVSDITRKAGIGRTTFYAHFDSKDALLEAELARIVLPMLVELPTDPCLVDCTALFEHLRCARDVYRSLTSGASRAVTERIIQDGFERRIQGMLDDRRARERRDPGLQDFIARFVASTILALIAWALDRPDPPSPAEMQATYRMLMGRALGAPRLD